MIFEEELVYLKGKGMIDDANYGEFKRWANSDATIKRLTLDKIKMRFAIWKGWRYLNIEVGGCQLTVAVSCQLSKHNTSFLLAPSGLWRVGHAGGHP